MWGSLPCFLTENEDLGEFGLRPKLMTVVAVLASLIAILWESGVGSDVMNPIAAPIVGGMITSTIHVLILVPVFFVTMKTRALRQGRLRSAAEAEIPKPAQELICPTVLGT